MPETQLTSDRADYPAQALVCELYLDIYEQLKKGNVSSHLIDYRDMHPTNCQVTAW